MQIGILTTDTPHHRYFMQEMQNRLPATLKTAWVLLETKPYPWSRHARTFARQRLPNLWTALALNPYLQSKRLASKIDAYERPRFFPTGKDDWPAGITIQTVDDVNDATAAAFLDHNPCDIMFIYGTGLVRPMVYSRARTVAINAHGGRLPDYRGLDTNLWAALENRPQDMTVTLHQVAAKLDTGDIFAQETLPPTDDLSLVSLRYHTTLIVCDMTLRLLPKFLDHTVVAKRQAGESRYYGPMPYMLKLRADRNIRRWAKASLSLSSRRQETAP